MRSSGSPTNPPFLAGKIWRLGYSAFYSQVHVSATVPTHPDLSDGTKPSSQKVTATLEVTRGTGLEARDQNIDKMVGLPRAIEDAQVG